MNTFLDHDEVTQLTGRKSKSKQIETLRTMGLPFWINASGHPVVSRKAVEGQDEKPGPTEQTWELPA